MRTRKLICLVLGALTIIFYHSAFAQVTFPAATTIDAPDIPYELAKGDFNGDGKADLITANFTGASNQQLTLLLSNTSGSYTGSNFKNFAASTFMIDVAVGDFNKDSKLDVVACSAQNNNFSLLLGDGAGGFATSVNFAAGDLPQGIAVGDMNKDGNPDVLVSHRGTPDDLYIYFGNGVGGFSAPNIIPIPDFASDVAVGDFNKDSNTDFAITASAGSVITVQIWNGNGLASPTFIKGQVISGFSNISQDVDAVDVDNDGDIDLLSSPGYSLNDGTGTFASPLALPESDQEFTIGDLNGDGHPDIVAADFSTSIHPNINVFLGDGLGSFKQLARFEITAAVNGLALVDANSDGKADLVAAGGVGGQGKIDVLTGDGTGYFSNSIIKYPTTTDPRDIVKGDFNEDGLIDIALCHSTSTNNVSVYLGLGQGRFAKSPTNYNAGAFPFQILAVDYNKDNHLDLITLNLSTSSTLTVLTGAGTGQFAALPDISVVPQSGKIAAADFNNDGFPDLAITGGTLRTVYLLTGKSSGFNAPSAFTVTQDVQDVKAADLNKDGNQDMAVFFNNASMVAIISGNGAGGFTEGAKYAAKSNGLRIEDLNADGNPDINVYDVSNAGNDFLINDGTGVFTGSSTSAPIGGIPMAYVDMDGDGIKDLVSGSQFSNSSQPGVITINQGTASGPSLSSLAIKTFSGGNRLVTHDVNGDGKEDIIATSFNNTGDYLSVILNTSGAAACVPPTINSVAPPTSVCSGEEVTLIVTVNGTPAFSYVWKKDGTVIPGETSASLVLDGAPADAGSYTAVVTNGCGTISSAAMVVTILTGACANHKPVITTENFSAVVGSTATIDLSSLISDADDNLDLSSLKIIASPQSGASASITDGTLTIDYEGLDFTGTDQLTIEVCDLAGSCTQQDLFIDVNADILVYNGFSPNGDILNATWQIKNIALFTSTRTNKVTIHNRWGDQVFQVENYDNQERVFKGLSNNGGELPSGTYFYKIEFSGEPAKKGFLVLQR